MDNTNDTDKQNMDQQKFMSKKDKEKEKNKKNKEKTLSYLLVIVFTTIIVTTIILMFMVDKRSALQKQEPYCFTDEVFYNGSCVKCPINSSKEGEGTVTHIPGCKCSTELPIYTSDKVCSSIPAGNTYYIALKKEYLSNDILYPTLVFPYVTNPNFALDESNNANINAIKLFNTANNIIINYINELDYESVATISNTTSNPFYYDFYLDPDGRFGTKKIKQFLKLTLTINENKSLHCIFYNMYGIPYNFVTNVKSPATIIFTMVN